VIGALVALALAAAAPVGVLPRRDVPWTVVVRASPDPGAVCPTALQPLLLRGAQCAREVVPGGALLIAEGPPELLPELRAALGRDGDAALFVEGAHQGGPPPLPAPRAFAAGLRPAAPSGADVHVLAVAPSTSLFDVEGEALVRLVRGALPTPPDAPRPEVSLAFAPGGAWLVMRTPGMDTAAVRAAIAPLADKPLPPAQLTALERASRAAVAERRARIGAWSREMGRAWLVGAAAARGTSANGANGGTSANGANGASNAGAELGARLRARLVPAAIR
jgi:hypothetical protein